MEQHAYQASELDSARAMRSAARLRAHDAPRCSPLCSTTPEARRLAQSVPGRCVAVTQPPDRFHGRPSVEAYAGTRACLCEAAPLRRAHRGAPSSIPALPQALFDEAPLFGVAGEGQGGLEVPARGGAVAATELQVS